MLPVQYPEAGRYILSTQGLFTKSKLKAKGGGGVQLGPGQLDFLNKSLWRQKSPQG